MLVFDLRKTSGAGESIKRNTRELHVPFYCCSKRRDCAAVSTYPEIRPLLNLLQTLADFLEPRTRLFNQVADPLADPFRLALGAQECDLVGKAGDVRGQAEQLVGKLGGEALELWVVGILGIVLPPPGRWLRFQPGRVVEGHGRAGYEMRWTVVIRAKRR